MKKKQVLALCMAALMGASMLAACGKKEETKSVSKSTATTSSKKEEAVEATLTVWSPQEDQAKENGDWLNTQLEAFKKAHPEWKLTFKTGVCSEGDAKTLVASDPEAAADVFMYANDQIPDLLKSKALAELGGKTVEDIKANNSEVTVNTVTYENAVYGVPFTANTWFMYYDKRVFSEDDAKNLDKMLTKGKVGFPLSNSWYFASFYVANGNTFFGEKGADAKAGFDFKGDKAVAVTNYLVDLVKNPNFKDANGLTPSTLKDGTVNAFFSGTWDYANVVEALGEENVGIAPAPTYTLNGKELQLKSFAGSKAIGVNPNSKNPQVAVALAAFLGSAEAQKSHYELRKIIPTDKSVDVSKDALAQAQLDTMDKASIVQPLQAAMGQYWGPAEAMGKEIVAGTVTHDNAAEKTDSMNNAFNTSGVQ
ncbi:MAG: extracellular solute-binding protein [Lachnospiraceae bacterium]|nr:extracellular solute-binding protein [Lachnospiraceae bacterium]MDY5741498.1 extracellular solute-binding protein [Lachnospiraceae bacterium]